ncbi:MAG TPA: mandelate racemase/muconate lactonizing enzyme family protein [Fimbriiglobus sp.]|jgi:L-alanine-DL-glutamate epimerase-like enolase superfamily enzyme
MTKTEKRLHPPMTITRIETDLLRVPLKRPVSLPASQDPRPATDVDVILVRVLTSGGTTGLGFAYTLGGGGPVVKSLLDTVIADVVRGQDPNAVEFLYLKAWAELEGLGFTGLAARAYAAVDFALWDLKGKQAGLPVHRLLGGYRTKLKAIVSDAATPAVGTKQAIAETKAALDRGAAGVQIEVGTQDPEFDVERVRRLREEVPDGAWFEISACGRYDYSTAAWMGEVGADELGIDGYSDPLRPDDFDGLGRLVDRLNVGLSVGALATRPDDLVRVVDHGGIDAVRIDLLRLGGLTPARKVAAYAELKHVAVYPVRLPEIGTHLSAGVVYGRMCEHVDWFKDLFHGGPRFENNQLVVSSDPGLGLTVNEVVAAKYRV